MMESSKYQDKVSAYLRERKQEEEGHLNLIASQSPPRLPTTFSSGNARNSKINAGDRHGGTINRNSNLNCIHQDENGQQRHSYVYRSDMRRISQSNGSSTQPPPPLSHDVEKEYVHCISSFDSSGYGLLNTQKLDSFLDQYEQKYGLEPLNDEVENSTKFQELVTLIKSRNVSYRKIAELIREIKSLPTVTPLCLLEVGDTAQDRNGNNNAFSNESLEEQTTSIANMDNSNDVPMKKTGDSNILKSSAQENPSGSNVSKTPQLVPCSVSNTVGSDRKSQEVSANTIMPNSTLQPPSGNLVKNNATTSCSHKLQRRINPEVTKSPDKKTTSQGVKIIPQPQHIDNSKDAFRGNKSQKNSTAAFLTLQDPQKSSPPTQLPPSSASKAKVPPTEGLANANGGKARTTNQNSKSKIPVLLPNLKSKSVNQKDEMKIPCAALPRTSTISSKNTENSKKSADNNNLAQQVEEIGKGKTEVASIPKIDCALVMKQDSKVTPLPTQNIDQTNPTNNTKTMISPKPNQVIKSPVRRIGEGDEVSQCLGLIDGLSGHTTWVMTKLLEYPDSEKDAKDKMKDLKGFADVGDFFGVPYIKNEAKGHFLFGGGTLPVFT